jgi:hypothetical protein
MYSFNFIFKAGMPRRLGTVAFRVKAGKLPRSFMLALNLPHLPGERV